MSACSLPSCERTRSRRLPQLAAHVDSLRYADARPISVNTNEISSDQRIQILSAGHKSPRSPLGNAPLIWWLAEPPRTSSGLAVHNTGG